MKGPSRKCQYEHASAGHLSMEIYRTWRIQIFLYYYCLNFSNLPYYFGHRLANLVCSKHEFLCIKLRSDLHKRVRLKGVRIWALIGDSPFGHGLPKSRQLVAESRMLMPLLTLPFCFVFGDAHAPFDTLSLCPD